MSSIVPRPRSRWVRRPRALTEEKASASKLSSVQPGEPYLVHLFSHGRAYNLTSWCARTALAMDAQSILSFVKLKTNRRYNGYRQPFYALA